MARKYIDENLEEDILIPVSSSNIPEDGMKKGREIIYKKDRTGWLVLPFAFLLALFCVFSAVLSFSEDPSGGVAGQTFDMVLETLGTFREAPEISSGNDGPQETAVSESIVPSGGAIDRNDDDTLDNKAHSFTIDENLNLFTQDELIPNRNGLDIDVGSVTRSSISSGVSLKSMMKGSWEGNVYRNQFAEFTLTLDDKWDRKNESESYIISTEDVVGALVTNSVNGDNILIRFFNMAVTSGGQEVYEEDFLEGMKRMGEQDQNLNAIFGDVFLVNVGSKQYKGIKESVEGVINLYYLARRIGDYMSIISIKSDDELEAILKMFN